MTQKGDVLIKRGIWFFFSLVYLQATFLNVKNLTFFPQNPNTFNAFFNTPFLFSLKSNLFFLTSLEIIISDAIVHRRFQLIYNHYLILYSTQSVLATHSTVFVKKKIYDIQIRDPVPYTNYGEIDDSYLWLLPLTVKNYE